ncbi:MAG TPA: DUF4097 family beta strand repeat-containing protein [bacterium]|jgi:hypothetical protein
MDEEQQIILRMLKEGKISIEEADALLGALGEQRAQDEAEASAGPEVPAAHIAADIPAGPRAELGGLREEIQTIIGDILKTVPKEVTKGMRLGLRGVRGPRRHGFFDLLQGLRGLEEGQSELIVTETLGAGETLEVRNAWGDVQLQPAPGDVMTLAAQVRVWGATADEAQRVASRLTAETRRVGSVVVITIPRMEGWRVRADLKIDVPSGVNVTLVEAKGDVQARGLSGSLRVGVAAGDVEVTDHQGPVDIDVKSGDLTVHQIDGDVAVDVKSGDVEVAQVRGLRGRISSGDVDVTDAAGLVLDVLNGDLGVSGVNGDVRIETKSGDIQLRRVRSTAVRVRAVSGDVEADLEEFSTGDVQIETVSGDIEVALPATARVTVDASVRSGKIECTLPLQDARRHRRTLQGVLNAPDGRVTLHALSGDIEIREHRG